MTLTRRNLLLLTTAVAVRSTGQALVPPKVFAGVHRPESWDDSGERHYAGNEEIRQAYHKWCVHHKKRFVERRLKIFAANYKSASPHEPIDDPTLLNRFADLSLTEYRTMMKQSRKPHENTKPVGSANSGFSHARRAYGQWCQYYEKEATELRYMIFAQNFAECEKNRSEGNDLVELEEYADLTPEEIAARDEQEADVAPFAPEFHEGKAMEESSAPRKTRKVRISMSTTSKRDNSNVAPFAGFEGTTSKIDETDDCEVKGETQGMSPIRSKLRAVSVSNPTRKASRSRQPPTPFFTDESPHPSQGDKTSHESTVERDPNSWPSNLPTQGLKVEQQNPANNTRTYGDNPESAQLDRTPAVNQNDKIEVAYTEWCELHGKERSEWRFHVFRTNYIDVQKFTRKTGKKMTMNEHSDLSSFEYDMLMQKQKVSTMYEEEIAAEKGSPDDMEVLKSNVVNGEDSSEHAEQTVQSSGLDTSSPRSNAPELSTPDSNSPLRNALDHLSKAWRNDPDRPRQGQRSTSPPSSEPEPQRQAWKNTPQPPRQGQGSTPPWSNQPEPPRQGQGSPPWSNGQEHQSHGYSFSAPRHPPRQDQASSAPWSNGQEPQSHGYTFSEPQHAPRQGQGNSPPWSNGQEPQSHGYTFSEPRQATRQGQGQGQGSTPPWSNGQEPQSHGFTFSEPRHAQRQGQGNSPPWSNEPEPIRQGQASTPSWRNEPAPPRQVRVNIPNESVAPNQGSQREPQSQDHIFSETQHPPGQSNSPPWRQTVPEASREDLIELAYGEWCLKYQRPFDRSRVPQFSQNYEFLVALHKSTGKTVHLNEFADLPPEEFQSRYPLKGSPAQSTTARAKDRGDTEDRARQAYREWCQFFEKVNSEWRFQIFVTNYEAVEAHNLRTGIPMKLNEFADLSPEEYNAAQIRRNENGSSGPLDTFRPSVGLTNSTEQHQPDLPKMGASLKDLPLNETSPTNDHVQAQVSRDEALLPHEVDDVDVSLPSSGSVESVDPNPRFPTATRTVQPMSQGMVIPEVPEEDEFERLQLLYADWCSEYNKTASEWRQQVFSSNYLEVEDYRRRTGKNLEMNEFSDLTAEEFREQKEKEKKSKLDNENSRENAEKQQLMDKLVSKSEFHITNDPEVISVLGEPIQLGTPFLQVSSAMGDYDTTQTQVNYSMHISGPNGAGLAQLVLDGSGLKEVTIEAGGKRIFIDVAGNKDGEDTTFIGKKSWNPFKFDSKGKKKKPDATNIIEAEIIDTIIEETNEHDEGATAANSSTVD